MCCSLPVSKRRRPNAGLLLVRSAVAHHSVTCRQFQHNIWIRSLVRLIHSCSSGLLLRPNGTSLPLSLKRTAPLKHTLQFNAKRSILTESILHYGLISIFQSASLFNSTTLFVCDLLIEEAAEKSLSGQEN